MIDASLLDDFIPEALDQLEILESNIILLETRPDDDEIISVLFRAAHTIKGSSEYIGLNKIATVAHRLENLLDMVRKREIEPNREMGSILINLHDTMAGLVNDLLNHRQEKTEIDRVVGEADDFCEMARGTTGTNEIIKASGRDPLHDEAIQMIDNKEENPAEDKELADIEDFLSRELDEETVVQAETPGAEVQDSRAAFRLSAKGSYEEENDEELFSIFMDHLEENLNLLFSVIADADNRDPKEVLLHCGDIVKVLRSSAAYMDYRELVSFYDAWRAQITTLAIKAERGIPVSFSFITDYMDQLIYHFSLSEKYPVNLSQKEPLTDNSKNEKSDQLPEQEPEQEMETKENALEYIIETDSYGLFDELDEVFATDNKEELAESQFFDPFEDDIEDELSSFHPIAASISEESVSKEVDIPSGSVEASIVGVKNEIPDDIPHEIIDEILDDIPEEPSGEDHSEIIESFDIGPAYESHNEENSNHIPLQKKDTDEQTGKMIYDDSHGSRVSKQTLRVATDKIDKLMNQVGELVVNRASYAQLYYEMRDFQRQIRSIGLEEKESKWLRDFTFRLSEATVGMGRVANELQEGVMKIRMLPISQLFNRYPRLVRDLVHNTGKQVQLEVHGEETELDKMVIEEIADPLVHIIRNAVDHGIEKVADRVSKGKPEVGVVYLNAFHESNHVVIEIIDDGCGIDLQHIRNVAIEKGFTSRDEAERMRSKDLMSIIMMPGFSISETITTTSGRGVGMDVVKKNVEKLNGTIEIDSEVDKGTRIRIKIPLTLAIINALLVRVGGEVFTIPLSVIEETLRIHSTEIYTIEGIEVIQLRDGVLSLLRLSDEFKKKTASDDLGYEYVVVVNTGMRQIGLVVDSLIGQEEAVIKPLVDFLQERSGFSGATILGDGSVSLILDVYELVNICMERQSRLKHDDDYILELTPDLMKKGREASSANIN